MNLDKHKIEHAYRTIVIFYIPLFLIGRYLRYSTLSGMGFSTKTDGILNIITNGYTKAGNPDGTVVVFGLILRAINIFNITDFWYYEYLLSAISNIWLFILLYKSQEYLFELNILKTALMFSFIVLLNVNSFVFAKDFMMLITFIVMFYIIKSDYLGEKQKFYCIIAAMLLAALFLKTYYYYYTIVFVFMTIYFKYIIKSCNNGFLKMIIHLIVFTVFYAVIINMLKDYMPSYYNKMMQVSQSDYILANSRITPFIKGSGNAFAALNYFIKTLRLMFPIELIRLGPKYIPYIFVQIVISCYIINNIINYSNLGSVFRLCNNVLFAFILTSATFEPDFGSWLRHEMATFPVIFYMLYILNSEMNKGE